MKRGLIITALLISALLISILITQLSFMSTILLTGFSGYLTVTISMLIISTITYFSFISLNMKKSTNLLLMISISIISLITIFLINDKFKALLSNLDSLIGGGVATIFQAEALISVWTFSILVIITYNIIPFLGLFKRTASSEKSLA